MDDLIPDFLFGHGALFRPYLYRFRSAQIKIAKLSTEISTMVDNFLKSWTAGSLPGRSFGFQHD
jgi:hypothetical protein